MEREAAEQKLIHKLDCMNRGFNRDSCFLSHYITDSSPPFVWTLHWSLIYTLPDDVPFLASHEEVVATKSSNALFFPELVMKVLLEFV